MRNQIIIEVLLVLSLISLTPALAFGWNQERDAAESSMRTHDYERAEKNWHEALKQLPGENDPRYSLTVRGLADVYLHEGNTVAAEHLYSGAKAMVAKSTQVDQGLLDCLSDYKSLLTCQNRSSEANEVAELIQTRKGNSIKPIDSLTFEDDKPIHESSPSFLRNSSQVRMRTTFSPTARTASAPNSFSSRSSTNPVIENRSQPVRAEYSQASNTPQSWSLHSASVQSSYYRPTPSVNSVMHSYGSTPTINSVMRSYSSTPTINSVMSSYGSTFSSPMNSSSSSSYSSSSYSEPTPSVSQTIRSEPGMASSSFYHH